MRHRFPVIVQRKTKKQNPMALIFQLNRARLPIAYWTQSYPIWSYIVLGCDLVHLVPRSNGWGSLISVTFLFSHQATTTCLLCDGATGYSYPTTKYIYARSILYEPSFYNIQCMIALYVQKTVHVYV